MKAPLVLLTMAMAVGAAAAGTTLAESTHPDARYWLHPKQGMVKVSGAANAVVVTDRAPAGAANATSSKGAKTGTYYWLHPKQGVVKVDRATNAIVVRR